MHPFAINVFTGLAFIILGMCLIAKYIFKFGIATIRISLSVLLMYLGVTILASKTGLEQTCYLSLAGIGCIFMITMIKSIATLLIVYITTKLSWLFHHNQHNQHKKNQ